MLALLISVSSGHSPALSAAARHTEDHGFESLLSELEDALVPVNRAAARRSIARLARDVTRCVERVKKFDETFTTSPDASDGNNTATEADSLAATKAFAEDADAYDFASEETTPNRSDSSLSESCRHSSLSSHHDFDNPNGLNRPSGLDRQSVRGDGLYTYVPPVVDGGTPIDYGTVSPPNVDLYDAHIGSAATADTYDVVGVESDTSVVGTAESDVGSTNVSMLCEADKQSTYSRPSDVLRAPVMSTEYRSPRNPRVGVMISIALLLLALVAIIVLYAKYPAMLFGR